MSLSPVGTTVAEGEGPHVGRAPDGRGVEKPAEPGAPPSASDSQTGAAGRGRGQYKAHLAG